MYIKIMKFSFNSFTRCENFRIVNENSARKGLKYILTKVFLTHKAIGTNKLP